MDSFINLAKQGYDAYDKSSHSGSSQDKQNEFTKTGGQEFNDPHHSSSTPNPPWFDEREVVAKASSEGSGDSSLFASALNYVNSNSSKHEDPIDEESAIESHREIYERGTHSGMSASSMGSAAALEVMKKFTGGGDKHDKKHDSKTDLISLAMAEASKLFDKSGGSSHGNKQDAVNSAGMTIMKLMVQSKLSSGHTTGGKDSGGLSGLMSMAGKFMK